MTVSSPCISVRQECPQCGKHMRFFSFSVSNRHDFTEVGGGGLDGTWHDQQNHCLQKIRNGNMGIVSGKSTGHPKKRTPEKLQKISNQNQANKNKTVRQLAADVELSATTCTHPWKRTWNWRSDHRDGPHNLTRANKQRRVTLCRRALECTWCSNTFLDRLTLATKVGFGVTSPKPNRNPWPGLYKERREELCGNVHFGSWCLFCFVFWDSKGVVFREFTQWKGNQCSCLSWHDEMTPGQHSAQETWTLAACKLLLDSPRQCTGPPIKFGYSVPEEHPHARHGASPRIPLIWLPVTFGSSTDSNARLGEGSSTTSTCWKPVVGVYRQL